MYHIIRIRSTSSEYNGKCTKTAQSKLFPLFSNYDISEIFGLDIFALKTIIDLLHSPVTVNYQPKGVIYNVTPAQNNLNAAAPGEEYNR